MPKDIEKLVEELKGIRGHLDALESAARGYMHDRFWKKGSILEEQQKEFDEQAFPWALYNFPSPLEVIAMRRDARKQVRREASGKPLQK